jgi:membrane-associated phospholipid phosphatase
MSTMSGADVIAVAGTAGTHALAWYIGLQALLLACESFSWMARAHAHRTGGGDQPGHPGSPALPVLGVGLFIAAAAGFAGIAYVTRNGAFALADQVFLDAVQANISAQVVKDFKWITWFGDARTLALLCIGTAAALLARSDKALALGMVAAVGGNGLLNGEMKRLFERSCPRLGVDPLLGHGLCFPSGHTSGAVVTYGMLAYVLMRTLPKRWHLPVLMAATTLIFTVGCSRVFVQAHFPSDVLAGFASGMAWLALVVVCTEAWLRGWRPGVRRYGPARQSVANH